MEDNQLRGVEQQNNNSEQSPSDGSQKSTKQSPVAAAPSIELPKGGGAIRGIGEKFAANPVTGTGAMSVPIATTPGRSGFGPQLALSYDSGSGNGVFGFGWSMGNVAISRKTDKGLPQYQDATESDVFMLSGAEDLVPVIDEDGNNYKNETTVPDYIIYRYRPRIEGLFAHIERWVEKASGDTHWRAITPDNTLSIYGLNRDSRIADPEDPHRIFNWLICESRDDKGNAIVYDYKSEDGVNADLAKVSERNRGGVDDLKRRANRYLKRIRYGNQTTLLDLVSGQRPHFLSDLPEDQLENTQWHFEVVCDYGEHDQNTPQPNDSGDWLFRKDALSSYRAGFEVRTTRLCKRVLMFHHFADEENVRDDCLVSSTDFSYSEINDKTAYTFIQSATQIAYKRKASGEIGYDAASMPPVEFEYTKPIVQDKVKTIPKESLDNLPTGVDGSNYRWMDLHGEGIPGIFTEQAGGWFYKRNISPISEGKVNFTPVEQVAIKPNTMFSSGAQLLDLDSDGRSELVMLEGPTPGYYEHDGEEGWLNFKPFTTRLNRSTQDPNTRFIDLTGDGQADVFITEDNAFIWHASLAKEGFAPAQKVIQALDEEHGPRLVFADGTQSIYLSDLSGDGLTDLVRIKNGNISYWPNLGYGHFGAKVTMDNAPHFDVPDLFEHQRIRLADIDGTGTTDIIYLHHDGVQLYFNQSGNGWSEAQQLKVFPRVDDMVSIMLTDLLGNGTACLVWSSSLPADADNPMRYVNLMGDQKPHLLVKTINNLGAETQMEYVASTKFYLQDKANGTPWVTKLPFPVHVVHKVTTKDLIARTRFSSEYSYHHGYYDRAEREFLGFGRVDQLDTETYDHFVKNEAANVVEEDLHQAPVLSKTWFHTGAFIDKEKILAQFAHEYFQNENLAEYQLPEAELPNDLSTQEWREALRACKGIALRAEVYALDGSDKEALPFAVTQTNCQVKRLQAKGTNKHAVFLSLPSESIAYNYERNLLDPRIAHSLTLATDEFGNVLKSAEVVYPRLIENASLADEAANSFLKAEQKKQHIIFTEADYSNDIDEATALHSNYRLRQGFESRAYELTGVTATNDFYSISDLITASNAADEIAYEEKVIEGVLQKRLIEQARTYFLNKDNLTTPLPLGIIDSLGLAHQAYQLAFTPALVTHLYGSKVTPKLLEEAAYVHCDDINGAEGEDWWIPSGTSVFPVDAIENFYLPIGAKDPFGNDSRVEYDGYNLLPIKSIDALKNTVVAKHDYRLLQPTLITDPNGNRVQVATDILGMVIATAVMGKAGDNDGDSLVDLINSPTTRLEYKLDNWQLHQQPNFSHSFVREQHGADNLRWHETLSYSDGGGNVIMVKAQAEPGVAKEVDEAGNVLEVDTRSFEPERIRWIGNGRTIVNNKGKPVKQYEPYFSTNSEYEDAPQLVEMGVTAIMYYDAMGRPIKTEMPDGTFSKVEFDAWQSKTFDANDTVLESEWFNQRSNRLIDDELLDAGKDPEKEQTAANKAAKHANTPATQCTDSLARPILTVEHNKNTETNADEFYHTRINVDIEGNTQSIIDARGNTVMAYKYDMLGNQVFQDSMDAGQRWSFVNVAGNPIRSWDERNHEFQNFYDTLLRPTISKVIGGDIEGVELDNIISRVFYGENEPNPEVKNLRGQVVKLYDTGGIIETPEYDFKDQPLSTTRRLFKNYKTTPDWKDENLQDDLEIEDFVFITETDALGRITKQIAPDNSVITPAYNPAGGFLNGETVAHVAPAKTTEYIKDINYNEKGQRESITYGNNVTTRYEYDEQTFRLIQLITERGNGDLLQDLRYTYDPVGNITAIEDKVSPVVFYKQQATSSSASYRYDALYRLQQAGGRENITPPVFNRNDNWNDLKALQQLSPNGEMAIQNYQQFYTYDAVGNIEQMHHQAVGNSWTRDYEYQTANNRLISTKTGNLPENTYAYEHHEKHGYISKMSHLEDMGWNFNEELIRTTRQRVVDENATAETTYYQYDGEGQRIRKITENAATAGNEPNLKEQRIYIDGYEVYKKHSGNNSGLVRETLSLMDEEHRFVMIETQNGVDEDTEERLVRYQHHNHLGSASLEIEGSEAANIISYEEYHPYGTTAYQVKNKNVKSTAKRYRYTGMERDGESGLSYHSARYYLPWLGRWLSSDPIGVGDGVNLYGYARNNPILLSDINGEQATGHKYDERTKLTKKEWQSLREKYGKSEDGCHCMSAVYATLDSFGVVLKQKVIDRAMLLAAKEVAGSPKYKRLISGKTQPEKDAYFKNLIITIRNYIGNRKGDKETGKYPKMVFEKKEFFARDNNSVELLMEIGREEGAFGEIFIAKGVNSREVKKKFYDALIAERVDPSSEGYYFFLLSIKGGQHTASLAISVEKNGGKFERKVFFYDQGGEEDLTNEDENGINIEFSAGGTSKRYSAAPILSRQQKPVKDVLVKPTKDVRVKPTKEESAGQESISEIYR